MQLRLSHPMWMRGLKVNNNAPTLLADDVASYVDAWIERIQLR